MHLCAESLGDNLSNFLFSLKEKIYLKNLPTLKTVCPNRVDGSWATPTLHAGPNPVMHMTPKFIQMLIYIWSINKRTGR